MSKGVGINAKLYGLVSSGASFQLRDMVLQQPGIIGETREIWVPADDDVDMLIKGHINREGAESDRRLKDNQLAWIDQLAVEGRIRKNLTEHFLPPATLANLSWPASGGRLSDRF